MLESVALTGMSHRRAWRRDLSPPNCSCRNRKLPLRMEIEMPAIGIDHKISLYALALKNV